MPPTITGTPPGRRLYEKLCHSTRDSALTGSGAARSARQPSAIPAAARRRRSAARPQADRRAGIHHRGQHKSCFPKQLPAACQVTARASPPVIDSRGEHPWTRVIVATRAAAHLCGETQRGTAVVEPACPRCRRRWIRCRPIAVRLPLGAASGSIESALSQACESLDHLTTFLSRQDRLRPMIARAPRSRAIVLTGADA